MRNLTQEAQQRQAELNKLQDQIMDELRAGIFDWHKYGNDIDVHQILWILHGAGFIDIVSKL